MASGTRNTILGTVTVTVAVLGAACAPKEAPPVAPPPPEVYVAEVVQTDVPIYLERVGQTTGFQDVEIRARVEGVLTNMAFQEGTFVRRGAALYDIDPKPLQAVLTGARADQSTAEARFEKASNDVRRYTPLVAKQAVSQQELDNARAEQEAARSQVDAAKAAVDSASLDLSYTRVSAPISGLVGTTLVKPGNLVGRGENTLLTTISQIDPILFRVGMTEADYLRIVRRPAPRANAKRASDIELTLADGSVHPHHGSVSTVDRAVDASTGTLGVQFEFPNPELVLRPGQFGRARVLIETLKGALLVPQRAVQEVQNLNTVAVVGADNKVAIRTVKVGRRVDNNRVVEGGLSIGDRVIVEGIQNVQDGMTVTTKAAPPDKPAATPPAGTR